MAKNRLFGWMFVEDSNKEPKPTVEPVIDVHFDGRRTDAIRQTTAFTNYVKQVEQIMSETHE